MEKEVKRSFINKIRKDYNLKGNDEEVLKWFERNYGLGYKYGTKYKIIENV